jgi:hypothetical protein
MGTQRNIKYYTLLSVDTTSNFFVFTPADSFQKGDAVCSFIKTRYYLRGTNLCVDSDENVIAEDLEFLSIQFLDKDYTPTSVWRAMRAAKVVVRAKSALPDKNYKEYNDHFHRVTLTYEFRLRNKVYVF